MISNTYTFEAELWAWSARRELWVFAALPEDASAEIGDEPRPPSGFGSVKVWVELGSSRWSTSIFPDSDRKAYVLPVKKVVRDAEGVGVGDVVEIRIEVVR